MNLEDLFEMSNLRKSETGLPVNIYVSSGGSIKKQHGPRLKAMITTSDKFNPHDTVSIILKKDLTADDVVGYKELPISTINALRAYVNLNYDVLIKYWNNEISTSEMISQIRKL